MGQTSQVNPTSFPGFNSCQEINMPWQEIVGAPCNGAFQCDFDFFCCCPEEQNEADKSCINVNTLSCVDGTLRHRENPPPPCITQPDFFCPSCVDCSQIPPPKCDDDCEPPRYCDFTPPTCQSCAQAVCKEPPTCDNAQCNPINCDPSMDLVPFTPLGECCPVDCMLKECLSNNECASGFCSKRPGACNEPGVCEMKPTQQDCGNLEPNPLPVCGCDGNTQPGYCLANAAGINVADFAPCQDARPQIPPTFDGASGDLSEDSSSSEGEYFDDSSSSEGEYYDESSSSEGWWDGSSSSDWIGDSSSSEPYIYEKPTDIFEVRPLGPPPVNCSYKVDCSGIQCPASCGGGEAEITCPIINFVPPENGGYCDLRKGSTSERTIPCVNNQPCVTDPSVPVDCSWDRYCGLEDGSDMFPCIAECGGERGYRECEVRNFIPARNGGTCKKERNSEIIYRTCRNKEPCPIDCTFELECEETCEGPCGDTGHKICTVTSFTPANEAGRCALPDGAGVGFQVFEECEAAPCSQTCPRSMADYWNHNDTKYATCEGELSCEYDEFCCCPEEAVDDDKGCLKVNKLTCNEDGKWMFEQAPPPECVTNYDDFICPSEPGGANCITCEDDSPKCDDSCEWPNYCQYNEQTCDTCRSAVCTAPPDCTGTICEDEDEISAEFRDTACGPNKRLETKDGECCGECRRVRCYDHSDCDGFCYKDPEDCDGRGVCQSAPNTLFCMMDEPKIRPVCGCDGNTYDGWCLANSAYTNVASFGECPKTESPVPTLVVNFVDDVWPILSKLNVAMGHSATEGGSATSMLDMTDVATAYTNIVNVASKELPTSMLVKPCSAEESYLYHKLSDTHVSIGGFGTVMPPMGGITEDELAMVRAWINGGAQYDADGKPVEMCSMVESHDSAAEAQNPDICPESMRAWRTSPELFATCTTGLHCEYDEFCCCPDEELAEDKTCVNANHLDCVNGVWQYSLVDSPECVTDSFFLCPTEQRALDPNVINGPECPASIDEWEASSTDRTGSGMPLAPCTTEGEHCRYDKFCCCPDEEIVEDQMCQMTKNLYCVNGFWEFVSSPTPECIVERDDFKCPSEPVCVECPGDLDPTVLPDCSDDCLSPQYCQYTDRTCETCYQATCMDPPVCDDIECAETTCTENEEEYVPNGECCPICRPKSCMVNDDCGDDFYCKKGVGECGGQGVCTQIPIASICPQIDPEPQPVCGCDGETHLGFCLAAAVGVNPALVGICPERPVEVAVPAAPGAILFATDHAFRSPIPVSDIAYPRDQVKEWKLHIYWHPNNAAEVAEAMILRENFVRAVANGVFVGICAGVNSEMVPGLVDATVPTIFQGPMGPHPLASFEIWAPREYFADIMGFITVNRGSLSVLVHPITRFQMEDHIGRSFWLGRESSLDMSALQVELPIIPKQYPELKLGYSAVPVKTPKTTPTPTTTTTTTTT